MYVLKMAVKMVLTISFLFLFSGCDDKAMVNIYNKKITQEPIRCMKLSVFPADKQTEEILKGIYPFTDECDLTLAVSTKSGIHCNSSFNAAAQATGQFPTGYLKMELKKGLSLQYSYYIDLDEKPDNSDIEKGFDRMKKDLQITW